MKNTDAKSMIVSTAKEELKIPENVLDAKMDSPSNKTHLEMFVSNNLIKPKIVKFSIYTTTANNVVSIITLAMENVLKVELIISNQPLESCQLDWLSLLISSFNELICV